MNKIFYCISLLFFCHAITNAQSPKQKSIEYFIWNYPEIKTSDNQIGFSVNEEELPLTATIFYQNGEKANILKTFNSETIIPSSFVKDLDLWSFETVPFNQAKVKVFLMPEATIFKIIGYKEKRGSNGEEDHYEGQLKIQDRIKVVVKDEMNVILYEKVLENVQKLHSISAFENQHIKTEKKAIGVMKAHFLEEKNQYLAQAKGGVSGPLYYKLITHLQDAIDLRRKKTTLHLYSYNKKKGYDFLPIETSIDELASLSKVLPSSDYQSELEHQLLPKIELWKGEAAKYDAKDKKERKIVWGLLANISGAYYALGENEKALDVYKEIEQLDFRKNYTYLKEFPEDQIESKKSFFGSGDTESSSSSNFSGTHNPSYVYYENTVTNDLGVNDAVVSEITLKAREERAFVLNKILSHYEYLGELKRLSKKFNKKGGVKIGFEETDAYFVEVFNRIVEESGELKFLDLGVLEDNEKVLVTKIVTELLHFYEIYDKEISLNKTVTTNREERNRNFDITMIFLDRYFSKNDGKQELDKKVISLTNLMILKNNETIRKLPFLEMLLDELSTENKLSYTKKPKLYKQLFKRYQKTYVSLFVDETSIKQHLHHSALSSIKNELTDYYKFYQSDLDEIEIKHKNMHSEARVVKILSAFMK